MSYEQTSLRCRNCRFWWPLEEPDQHFVHLREHAVRGQCRRHAPPPMHLEQAWAIVQYDDWCGEHSHVNA